MVELRALPGGSNGFVSRSNRISRVECEGRWALPSIYPPLAAVTPRAFLNGSIELIASDLESRNLQ
jgi:hypothetical protein